MYTSVVRAFHLLLAGLLVSCASVDSQSQFVEPRASTMAAGVPTLSQLAYLTSDLAASRQKAIGHPIDYAWDVFYLSIWPAKAGAVGRGVADSTKKTGDLGGPSLWQSWKGADEVYQANGADPGPWASPSIAGSAGVIWQAGLAKESLEWSPDYAQSEVLKALREALEADAMNQGLVVRLATYRTLYYQTAEYEGVHLSDAEKLSHAYKNGFTGGNPARSVVTGNVGIWGAHELSSGPTERLLVPMNGVGPAAAAVDSDRHVVTVDMIAMVPETNEALDKEDLGNIELQVVPADGGSALSVGSPLAPDQYARGPYELRGGLVDFDMGTLDPADIERGTLKLVRQDGGGLVGETPLVADTDQRGGYLDEGESVAITVHVYERGQPVADGRAKVLVTQVDTRFQPGAPIVVRADGQPVDNMVLDVAGGTVQFSVAPKADGIRYLFYTPFFDGDTQPASNPNPTTQGYTVVRCLPFDNHLEASTTDDQLSWKFLYENVLVTWDVIYPVMSVVRSLHNRDVFAGMAEQIRFAIDPSRFESAWYMPITRELSAGKRKLILRYLNLLPNRVPEDEEPISFDIPRV